MATTRQVLTIGGISFLTVGLTYCLYFDYKRRNDPVFRKKLLKEQRRLAKKTQAQDKNASRELEKVLAAAVEAVNSEPLPTTVEGKEQFFMEQVGIGEMLASKMPRGAMPAAIAFFKAYKVYPSPQELMIIYQRTMPAEIFSIIVEMIKIDVNKVISSAKSSYRSSGPRRPSSDGPVIEEITGDERALIDALKSSAPSVPTAVPPKPSSNVTKTPSEQESASESNSPPTSELMTESNPSKSLLVDFTAENGSKAPSENGSVTAASQTANSFVLVDDDSDAHGGTSTDAPRPIIPNEVPQDVPDAVVDSSSTTVKTEPPQTLEPVHLSVEVIDNLNENPGKSQAPSTVDAASEQKEQ